MRDASSSEYIVGGKGPDFNKPAQSVDSMGWRRYMEGKVSSGILKVPDDFTDLRNYCLSLNMWAIGPVIKLLEIPYSQWLYRTIPVHVTESGFGGDGERRGATRRN